MSQNLNVLEKVDAFQILDNSAKESFKDIMEKRIVHEGEDLALRGEAALFFFILESGGLLLSFKEEKALVLREPGDFAGFELVSSKGLYTATIKALSDGEIFFLNRGSFLEIIKEDSSLADKIISVWESYLLKAAPFIKRLDYLELE